MAVPGVLIKVAVMEPPYRPPQYAPRSWYIAGKDSMWKVIVIKTVTAKATLKPGIAPTIMPTATPAFIIRRLVIVKML